MRLSKKQKEILKWGMENLKGKSIYCPILDCKVYFSAEGLRHSVYYKPSYGSISLKIGVFKNIAYHIEKSDKCLIEFDKNNPKKRVFKPTLEAVIEGQKYRIYIVIKERGGRKFYYDSGVIKKV